MTKHKMRDTKEYRAWLRMKGVCYNKNHKSYRTYGARGIRVQTEWVNDFLRFYKDMGEMPEGCTGIELIDLSKDFCLWNCRWVNPNNRRQLKDMPNQKNRETTRKYKQPKKMVVTLEKVYFEFFQRMAIEKSRELGEPISAPEYAKMILEQHCPMPTQYDLFKKEKRK